MQFGWCSPRLFKERWEVLVKVKHSTSISIADHKNNWIVMLGVGYVKFAKPSEGWIPPPENTSSRESAFKDIDNPGNWSPFSFIKKFKGRDRSGPQSHHLLLTRATDITLDKDSEKIINSQNFHHQG